MALPAIRRLEAALPADLLELAPATAGHRDLDQALALPAVELRALALVVAPLVLDRQAPMLP